MPSPSLPLVDREPVRPSPKARRVIVGIASAVTVLLLLGGFFNLLTNVARHQYLVTRTWSGAEVAALAEARLSNDAGHLEVTGLATRDVHVEVDVTDGLFRARHAERLSGDLLRTSGSCPLWFATHCRVDQRVQLPAGTPLDVHARHGHLTIRDVDGPVTIDAKFGAVRLTGLGGGGRISHEFNDLTATGLRGAAWQVRHRFGNTELRFDEAPVELRVDVQFGTTVIVLPDDGASYHVTGESGFGHRDIEVRTDPSSDRRIHLDTRFGDVTVRYALGSTGG
jgi:hypothetical protein